MSPFWISFLHGVGYSLLWFLGLLVIPFLSALTVAWKMKSYEAGMGMFFFMGIFYLIVSGVILILL